MGWEGGAETPIMAEIVSSFRILIDEVVAAEA